MLRQLLLVTLIAILSYAKSQNGKNRLTSNCLHNGCPMSGGLHVEDLDGTIKRNLLPTESFENVLKIMTYNIRQNNASWEKRKTELCDYFTRSQLTVFGLQNVRGYQLKDLNLCLKGYAVVANLNSYNNKDPMYDPLYYKISERITLVRSGTFWLSKTPSIPGSKLPNAKEVSACTWVRLQFAERLTQNTFSYSAQPLTRKESFLDRLLSLLKVYTGKISNTEHNNGFSAINAAPARIMYQWFDFYVAVTQLDSTDEGVAQQQAKILTKHLRNSVMDRRRYPLMLMGDFGWEDNTDVYKHFNRKDWLLNTMATAKQVFPAMTFVQPNSVKEKLVDYIWQNKFITMFSATMTDVENYHRPVFTALLPRI